jgi:putative serine protease PepD
MSQDMTPRPGDLPAEPARPNQTANSSNYSAPSPADRPTALPPGGQAWSQDMARDTGPVPTQNPNADKAWWEPRPSGAWAAPGWNANNPGGAQPGQAGAPGTAGGHGTRTFPAAGAGFGAPGYPSNGYNTGYGNTATAVRPPAEQPAKGRRTSVIVATAAAVALLAGFGGGLVGAQVGSSSGNSVDSSLSQLNTSAAVADRTPAPAGSVQEVASKVLPSTVSVLASSNQSSGEGSGIILSADGLILTNNHVIEGATAIEVRFNDGTTATATVVGSTATDDLAVLRADGVSGLTPATLGSSAALAVGQPVVAIGSPLGLSATVTSGIVSALNRPVRTASSEPSATGQSQDTVINAVQTDAAINPGNSGGALVDMTGAVIGINSAIASLSDTSNGSQAGSIGVGFAIPIDQAKRIAQEIIDTGKATHAVLGASVGDAADKSSQIPTGAQVADVTAGGGAQAAGLKAGDVITSIGGQPVESADALIAAVRSATPNGTTDVTFTRDGQSQTVSVTLGSASAN